MCCEQILEYLRKVNKTFASDIFRVFLFDSHKKMKLTSSKNSLFRTLYL